LRFTGQCFLFEEPAELPFCKLASSKPGRPSTKGIIGQQSKEHQFGANILNQYETGASLVSYFLFHVIHKTWSCGAV
jgi:hypothetical protein